MKFREQINECRRNRFHNFPPVSAMTWSSPFQILLFFQGHHKPFSVACFSDIPRQEDFQDYSGDAEMTTAILSINIWGLIRLFRMDKIRIFAVQFMVAGFNSACTSAGNPGQPGKIGER